MAEKCEISLRQYRNIERAKVELKLSKLVDISIRLGVSLDEWRRDAISDGKNIIVRSADSDIGVLRQGYIIGKGFIADMSKIYLPEKSPIIPPQRTIDDIVVVDQSLVDIVRRDPRLLHAFSSRQFEEMVCEIFEKKGYRTKMMRATRDGGKDFIVMEDSVLGNLLFYVECKKYRPDRPVGVNLVRELYGTICADRATAGIMVTSSYFSREAVRYQEKIRHRMGLVDYIQLTSLIQASCQ